MADDVRACFREQLCAVGAEPFLELFVSNIPNGLEGLSGPWLVELLQQFETDRPDLGRAKKAILQHLEACKEGEVATPEGLLVSQTDGPEPKSESDQMNNGEAKDDEQV